MQALRNGAQWLGEHRLAMWLVWLAFALPRVLVLLPDVQPTSDAAWYFDRARELAAGLGYIGKDGAATAYWPPGWPLTLSLLFRAFGPSVLVVGLFNLACALASGWLLLDLARRIGGSEVAGRIALLLYALYPNAVAYVPLALTEVFYTFLLLLLSWLLVVRPNAKRTIFAGLVLGLATLVKAQTLAVVPLILGIELIRQAGLWKRLPGTIGRFALLVGLAALVVAPWSLRNMRELGHFVAVSTNGGITLFTGNNDSARGDFTPDDPAVKALTARTDLDEVQWDAEAKRLGVEWIKEHPGGFVKLLPMKAFRLWGPDGEGEWAWQGGYADYQAQQGLFRTLRVANQAYYVLLLAGFALFALLTLRRRWRDPAVRLADWWLLPYGVAAYPTAICLVFSGQSRFHFPVMPFVCMACGWLLAEWLVAKQCRHPAA